MTEITGQTSARLKILKFMEKYEPHKPAAFNKMPYLVLIKGYKDCIHHFILNEDNIGGCLYCPEVREWPKTMDIFTKGT